VRDLKQLKLQTYGAMRTEHIHFT